MAVEVLYPMTLPALHVIGPLLYRAAQVGPLPKCSPPLGLETEMEIVEFQEERVDALVELVADDVRRIQIGQAGAVAGECPCRHAIGHH